MLTVPTNTLIQYTMQGQLLTNSGPNAYQNVYWDVYNAPDLTGQFSGYYGQLQNIVIASSVNISSPTSGAVVPTSAAGGDLYGLYPNPQVGGIQNIPIIGLPSSGQGPQFDGTSFRWVTPTTLIEPTPVVTSAGGAVNIPLNLDSWNESNASTKVTYTFQTDTTNYGHTIGWYAGAAPTVAAPDGWFVQSPVDGGIRANYVYGAGGNGPGERYVWRAIVALATMVPT